MLRNVFVSCALLALAACASAPMSTSGEVCASAVQPPPPTAESNPGIQPPVTLHRVEPQTDASFMGKHVTAVVEAIIGEDGVVRNVCVKSGDPTWGRAVAEAVRKWTFQPATLDGKPVATYFELTSNFKGN